MRVPWAMPLLNREVVREVVNTVSGGWVSMGQRVELLESMLAEQVARRHAVAVTNGTVALELALELLNVGFGDEVIVPALTYSATVSTVIRRGARPVFADVDPLTYNMDPANVEPKLSQRTACIIPIDYGGNPAPHSDLQELADTAQIPVLLDGAQSISGMYGGHPLCKQGTISTTSLHAAKLFTTVEGGVIFTDDDELARKARLKRNQGEDPEQKYLHVELGMNARLTDLQAAIGIAQIRQWDSIISKRRSIANAYLSSELRDLPSAILPPRRECDRSHTRRPAACQHGWFLFPILVSERDLVVDELSKSGVETRVCYPMPVYRQPFYLPYRDEHDGSDSCPTAEWVTAHVLNLPMYHQMEDAHIAYVVEQLGAALANSPDLDRIQ